MQSTDQRVSSKAILSHPEDIHCIIYHVVSLIAYGCAFWLYLRPDVAGIEGPWSCLIFVLSAAFLLGWLSGIDVGVNFHNHIHRPIFRVPWLNRWFGRVWTFSGGWPSFFWEHAHIFVHHANVLRSNDWTLPKRQSDGSFENIYVYCLFHWPWRYAVHLWQDFTTGHCIPAGGRQALRELGIFLVLWSIPFWIDPVMALGLWVLPHWIANVAFLGPGMYVQHAGCVEKSVEHPVEHSNTYLSRFFNLTMFNIGYHCEHHDYANVHWSELPALHTRLKGRLVDGGTHVMSSGYYRASVHFLSADAGWRAKRARALFAAQHPDYVKPTQPPAAPVRQEPPVRQAEHGV